jgi:hypothetical protein
MSVSPLQPKKALSPILVTELGIVTLPFLFPGQQINVLPALLYRTPFID